MQRILAAALFALFAFVTPSYAQSMAPVYLPSGCGTGNITNSQAYPTVDASGRLCVGEAASSNGGITPAPTAPALATSQVIKSSAGNLYSFEVSADSTLSAAAWWILIYDATSDPGNGAVTPRKCYAQVSGTTSAAYAWTIPIAFTTGIVIAVSTTGCYTETQSVHAFISGDAK